MEAIFNFSDYTTAANPDLSVVKSKYHNNGEPEHSHDFYELVLVQSGRGIHRFQDENFEIGSGHISLIRPGQKHAYDNLELLTLYSLIFVESALAPIADELNALPGFQLLFHVEPELNLNRRTSGNLHIPARYLPQAEQYTQAIQHELQEQSAGFRAASLVNFWGLLLHLGRHCEVAANSRLYRYAGPIGRVLSFMEKNLRSELQLPDLAREAGMSIGTFRRTFTHTLNRSPIHYLLEMRLRKAAALLCDSRRSVTEVAFATGFNDSNYFSHQFRKFYGMSPLRYRQLHPSAVPPGQYRQSTRRI